jgi:two-component system phosphate regulon sensor histidine kinase PhoR
MLRDFRWRIAIPYIILILVVMAALTIYISRTTWAAQQGALEASLKGEARILAEGAQSVVIEQDDSAFDDLAQQFAELLNVRATIIGPDGTVLGESDEDRSQMDNHLNRPEVQQALQSGEGSSIRYSQTLDTDMLYVATPFDIGEEVAVARVALPLSQVESNINQLQNALVTAAIVTAAAAIGVAILIAGRTSRTIHRLTEVARRMAAGDLDARLHLPAGDDLGDLTQAFNHMADELRERVNDLDDERGRLTAILDNMADGVLITDATGRVSLINPAAAHLLDVEEDEAVGRFFAEVARHHELIELWNYGCEQSEGQAAAVEISRQDVFIQMIVSPLETAGQEGCLVILQDLTRLRRLETVRHDFISNISHELRTPLASLKALIETLRDGAIDDPPAAQRFLERADFEVDALTQMVVELLELSRIESGTVPLLLQATAVEDVVVPPVERLRPQAERDDIDLTLDLAANLPPVLSDSDRVQQVVSNLVHNAIKFTPSGGKITVSAVQDLNDPAVIFSVKDAGVGIPANELPRIFERFYKADQARSGGGTGLGLAISRHLVQAHGGQIWAKSKESKGSTFYFSLPLAGDYDSD